MPEINKPLEDESFTQEKKIRVEHIYNNMNDLLKEVRFLDNTSLIFSGTIWAWILTNGIKENLVLSVIPLLVVILLAYKANSLLKEYRKQKKKYRKYLKKALIKSEKIKKNSKRRSINNTFYAIVIGANLIITLLFYYTQLGYHLCKVAH